MDFRKRRWEKEIIRKRVEAGVREREIGMDRENRGKSGGRSEREIGMDRENWGHRRER